MKLNIENWSKEEQILATVVYFDCFDLALRLEELPRLVLGRMMSLEEVLDAVKKLGNKVVVKEGLIFLSKREELLQIIIEKRRRKLLLDKKIARWKWIFGMIPFVRFVAVCNYNAWGDVSENSDIDIFVVTKPGRIFLARVLLTIVMHFSRLRRHDKKIAGRFCLSFYVTEDNLSFDLLLLENDIYFAYWILALRPLYCEAGVWKKLWQNNPWLKLYFEEYDRLMPLISETKPSWWKKIKELFWFDGFGNLVERFLEKYFVKKYLQQKDSFSESASVLVNSKILKYHNNDQRATYRDQWIEKLKGLGLFK